MIDMLLLKLLQVFQDIQDFPDVDNPENNIFDQIPGFGNTLFFIIIILILWFVVASLLAFWTYKDIKKKQLTGFMYVPIVLFTSFIGLVIYFIVRYNEKCALAYDEEACLLEDDTEGST